MARFETSVGIDDLVGKFDKHSRITMRRKAWKYPDGRIFGYKSIKIVITGHTDNYGDPRQNLEFYGIKRAEALKAYMVEQGVDAGKIRCDSKGDKEPIAPNDTRANRAKNRCVNIRFE